MLEKTGKREEEKELTFVVSDNELRKRPCCLGTNWELLVLQKHNDRAGVAKRLLIKPIIRGIVRRLEMTKTYLAIREDKSRLDAGSDNLASLRRDINILLKEKGGERLAIAQM